MMHKITLGEIRNGEAVTRLTMQASGEFAQAFYESAKPVSTQEENLRNCRWLLDFYDEHGDLGETLSFNDDNLKIILSPAMYGELGLG